MHVCSSDIQCRMVGQGRWTQNTPLSHVRWFFEIFPASTQRSIILVHWDIFVVLNRGLWLPVAMRAILGNCHFRQCFTSFDRIRCHRSQAWPDMWIQIRLGYGRMCLSSEVRDFEAKDRQFDGSLVGFLCRIRSNRACSDPLQFWQKFRLSISRRTFSVLNELLDGFLWIKKLCCN
jgi:hypothetical protein